MNTILKIIIAVATVAVIGAGGVALYQSQHAKVHVQAPPPPTPAPARKDAGDIDKLPPVTLPDNRTPAQKAGSETKR